MWMIAAFTIPALPVIAIFARFAYEEIQLDRASRAVSGGKDTSPWDAVGGPSLPKLPDLPVTAPEAAHTVRYKVSTVTSSGIDRMRSWANGTRTRVIAPVVAPQEAQFPQPFAVTHSAAGQLRDAHRALHTSISTAWSAAEVATRTAARVARTTQSGDGGRHRLTVPKTSAAYQALTTQTGLMPAVH